MAKPCIKDPLPNFQTTHKSENSIFRALHNGAKIFVVASTLWPKVVKRRPLSDPDKPTNNVNDKRHDMPRFDTKFRTQSWTGTELCCEIMIIMKKLMKTEESAFFQWPITFCMFML